MSSTSEEDSSFSEIKRSVVEESFEFLNVDEASGHIRDQASFQESSLTSSVLNPTALDKSSLMGESRHHYNPTHILFEGNPGESPLVTIENYERDLTSQLEEDQNLDSYFKLSEYQATAEKGFVGVKYSEVETITKYCYPDRSIKKPAPNADKWGTPKCIAINTKSRHIAIGMSGSLVFLFSFDFSPLGRIGTAREEAYGEVTAIDIANKEDSFICGYKSGHIVIWSTIKNETIKTIKPIEKDSAVLSVKFLRDSNKYFISSNDAGNVYQFKIDTFFMKLDVERKELTINEMIKKTLMSTGSYNPHRELPEGFFSIQILPKELVKNHPLTRWTVAGLTSMKRVVVVTLEPTFSIIYVAERPDGLNDSVIPSFSWGNGIVPGQDRNPHPLIALSWGKDLFLYQLVSTDHGDEGMKKVGYYLAKKEIVHLEWFSNDYVMLYDDTKELKVVWTGDFRTITHLNNSDLPFDYGKALIDKQRVGFEIKGQQLNKSRINQNSKPVFYFTNTIVGRSQVRNVYIMGEYEMHLGKHASWDESLEQLVKGDNWMEALALCVSLYRGTTRRFAGLPVEIGERRKVLTPVYSNVIKDYINKNTKLEDTEAVLIAIDFLVSVENFKYLFGEARVLFDKQNLKEVFLKCLEPFILKERINNIPDFAVKEVIKYYTAHEKLGVIQFFILHTPLDHVNLDFLITVCMQYNLLTPLMYLCPQKSGNDGPDFITPIAKAMSTFHRSLTYEQINARDHGIRFLWFVHMTVNGRIFPKGVIQEEIWETKVIKELIVLLFQEQCIDLTIKADPYIAFDIFRHFFQSTITNIIEGYKEDLFHNPKNTNGNNSNNKEKKTRVQETVELFRRYASNGMQGEMLGIIYYCGKKEIDHENLLFYMLADLCVYHKYTLPPNIVDECAFHIIQNSRSLPPWEANRNVLESREEDEEDKEVNMEERSEMVLELLKKIGTELTQPQIERLYKYANKEKFVDIEVYLLELQREYKRGFELYLGQQKMSQKYKVFKWLDHVIPALKKDNGQDFGFIKESIITRLKDLVRIDSEKTRKIFVGLDKNLEILAIYHLEPFPDLQLEYLKRILAKRKDGVDVPDKLLILHITLLCKLHPKQVLAEVKSYHYPLESCLDICRTYKIKDALAFFMEKNGNVVEALENCIEVFLESLMKKHEKIKQNKPFKKGLLMEKFNAIREICLRYNQIGDQESEKFWFQFLDRLLENYEKVVNSPDHESLAQNPETNKHLQKFLSTYSEFVSILFDDLSKYVLVESFLTKLQSYKHMKLTELKTSLLEVLHAYHHESNLLDSTVILLKGDTSENVSITYNRGAFGMKNNSIYINDARIREMLMFECGHIFSKGGIDLRVCPVCMNAEEARVFTVLKHLKRNHTNPTVARAPRNTTNPAARGGPGAGPGGATGGDSGKDNKEKDEKNGVAGGNEKPNNGNENMNMPIKKSRVALINKGKNLRKLKMFDDAEKAKTDDVDDFCSND